MLAAVAGEPGVHVVGGAVRDALLGRMPAELDLVVEGDAEPVARRAAERLGGEVTVHERFGTATVHAPPAVFDVTSARAETYPAPGALPEVRLGVPLAEDLARRDFSVNAIAMDAADGRLTAYPGRVRGPRGRRAAGPARRVVPGRPDAAAAARPLRGAARLRRRAAHRRAGRGGDRGRRARHRQRGAAGRRAAAARARAAAGRDGGARPLRARRGAAARLRRRRRTSSRGRWRWRPRTPAAT